MSNNPFVTQQNKENSGQPPAVKPSQPSDAFSKLAQTQLDGKANQQPILKIGSRRMEGYQNKSKLLDFATTIAQSRVWNDRSIPTSISARVSQQISPLELRIEDYYLIRSGQLTAQEAKNSHLYYNPKLTHNQVLPVPSTATIQNNTAGNWWRTRKGSQVQKQSIELFEVDPSVASAVFRARFKPAPHFAVPEPIELKVSPPQQARSINPFAPAAQSKEEKVSFKVNFKGNINETSMGFAVRIDILEEGETLTTLDVLASQIKQDTLLDVVRTKLLTLGIIRKYDTLVQLRPNLDRGLQVTVVKELVNVQPGYKGSCTQSTDAKTYTIRIGNAYGEIEWSDLDVSPTSIDFSDTVFIEPCSFELRMDPKGSSDKKKWLSAPCEVTYYSSSAVRNTVMATSSEQIVRTLKEQCDSLPNVKFLGYDSFTDAWRVRINPQRQQ